MKNSSKLRLDLFLNLSILASIEHCLPLHELCRTLDEDVHEIHLTLADAVRIRHIPGATSGGRVHTTSTTCLQAHSTTELLPILTSRQLGQHDHCACTETCAEVGGARQHPAQVVVVHEVRAVILKHLRHLLACTHEARSHFLDLLALWCGLVPRALHAHDAKVILLTHPHEQILVVIVEHTTAIGPVTSHARCEKQRRVRLLEEVAHRPKLLLLRLRHAIRLGSITLAAMKREIIALEVALHAQEALHAQGLQLAAFLERDRRRQLETFHATTSAHTCREHVLAFGVDVGVGQLGHVHVGWLLGIRTIAIVASTDDGIEQLLESVVGLLVACHQADCLDVWVPWVVHSSLHALSESDAALCRLAFEAIVHSRVGDQELCHEVGMLRQVWHRVGCFAVDGPCGLLFWAIVRRIATSLLNPLRQLPHVGREATRWIVSAAATASRNRR